MAENTKRFDPRFDPAFQPGYQATDEVKTPVGRPALPMQQPKYRIGERVAPRPEVEQPPIDPADPVRPVEAEGEEDAESRRNPYLVALWIVGGASIPLGMAGSYWQQSFWNSGFGLADQTMATLAGVVGSLSGSLMLVGLGCLAAALVISALRWRP